MATGYVHGFGSEEGARLQDQARTLEALLHGDTRYPAGSTVLEAGCGVGAQTVALAHNNPGALITAVDKAGANVAAARRATAGLPSVQVLRADIFALPFAPASFDHAFVCFVLEHLRDTQGALVALRRALKPGGTLTVVEGGPRHRVLPPRRRRGPRRDRMPGRAPSERGRQRPRGTATPPAAAAGRLRGGPGVAARRLRRCEPT